MWEEEKKRIEKLRWWDEVAGKHGFPADIKVWHVHPLAWVENFGRMVTTGTIEEMRVRAFLRMLRVGEGTVGVSGYEKLFGGLSFIKDFGKDFSDHPRIQRPFGKTTSSAAGAYQVMSYTWDDPNQIALRRRYNITDFTPKSQDRYCVVIIRHKRSALKEVMNGDIEGAINKCNREWASLPGAPYGQPTITMERKLQKFEQFLAEEMDGKSDLAVDLGELDDLLKLQ
jgi:muramidase (phage lysozyme)